MCIFCFKNCSLKDKTKTNYFIRKIRLKMNNYVPLFIFNLNFSITFCFLFIIDCFFIAFIIILCCDSAVINLDLATCQC